MYRYLQIQRYLKIGYILTSLFLYTNAAVPNRYETIVAYSTKNKQQAEDTLLTLKVYLHEKGVSNALDFSIEKMDGLYMITIKPILSREQRNSLLLLLQAQFSDAFYIKEAKRQTTATPLPKPAPAVDTKPTLTDKIVSIKTIDWIWFAIWILAVIGLIASMRNRYKMKHLSHQQQEIQSRQKQIENEIRQLGEG